MFSDIGFIKEHAQFLRHRQSLLVLQPLDLRTDSSSHTSVASRLKACDTLHVWSQGLLTPSQQVRESGPQLKMSRCKPQNHNSPLSNFHPHYVRKPPAHPSFWQAMGWL